MASKNPGEWIGVHRHGAGYRAVVSRGRGVTPAMKHFAAGTPPAEMQAWRQDERARLRLTRKTRASRGTFEGDARAYLRAVATMPTIKDRTRQIELWIAEFGTRQRDSITGAEIRAVLNRWRTESRGLHPKTNAPLPPLSANTVNLRKRALSNLYTILDADADPPRRNPVRAIDDFEETASRPRDLPYPVIARILARMPDHGRLEKGEIRKFSGDDLRRIREAAAAGASRRDLAKQYGVNGRAIDRALTGQPKGKAEDFSTSKIIAAILAYTGLEPVQLERLAKADVDLEFGFVVLSPRKKGKRRRQARARAVTILPLVPQAVAAFTEFDKRKLWGKPVDRSGLRKAFKAAARHEGVATVRIKDLRHSFSTVVVETTEDLELAKDLLMHTNRDTTKLYSARVLAQRLKVKLDPVVRHFAAAGGDDSGAG